MKNTGFIILMFLTLSCGIKNAEPIAKAILVENPYIESTFYFEDCESHINFLKTIITTSSNP